jgi:Ni/Fe-hydrogenase subunit HybB-like protein
MKHFIAFVRRCAAEVPRGGWRYKAWLGLLAVLCLIGLNAWARQVAEGLIVTGMSDAVSWGLYIANFTFLVGIAAAAVLLVIPVYVYRDRALRDLVVFGEWMAVAALLMCMAFVVVDLGRPDRVWHMIPGIGRPNFPSSILAWDMLVLSGYLLLNVYLATYLLYSRYQRRKPAGRLYMPFVFASMVWAIAIHTVTAFLFMGLGARPFWNTAIVGPRFIASAFAAGPALIVLILLAVRAATDFRFPARALRHLRSIIQVAMLVNIFLLANELFAEFYTDSLHVASATYLYFGLHGHTALVPWIWAALLLNITAMVLFVSPITRKAGWLAAACGMAVVGIWVEKGMGLIIPGFVPTPLGEIVEYHPSLNEMLVTLGIWAFGALCYTVLVKASLPVLQGRIVEQQAVYPEPAEPARVPRREPDPVSVTFP